MLISEDKINKKIYRSMLSYRLSKIRNAALLSSPEINDSQYVFILTTLLCTVEAFLCLCVCRHIGYEVLSTEIMCCNESLDGSPSFIWMPGLFYWGWTGNRRRLKEDEWIQIILAELVSAVMVILGCQSLLEFCDQWQMETDGKLRYLLFLLKKNKLDSFHQDLNWFT